MNPSNTQIPPPVPTSNRQILDHVVNGLNEHITLASTDQPGPGGANHRYALLLKPRADVPAKLFHVIEFQNGPVQSPDDMNGFTNEVYIAAVIDRMRGFQYERNADGSFNYNSRGKFACRENAEALTHFESGLMWLQKRTQDRMRRGVEGTHNK